MNPVWAAQLAQDMQQAEPKWTAWQPFGDSEIRARIIMDDNHGLQEDGDWFGTIYDERRDGQRPPECDGAARKVQHRHGIAWWQPPKDVVGNPVALQHLEERVRGYYLEHWYYVGVTVEVRRPPCDCCGHQQVVDDSLWGIESDAGEYFAEVIATLAEASRVTGR